MAGGNIVGDAKSSSMPNRNQLLKKKTDDNSPPSDQNSENKSQNDQSKFQLYTFINLSRNKTTTDKQHLLFNYFKEQNLTFDIQLFIEKNPFTQRRQTAGQSNFDDKKNENDDSDSDDFDEFYNKNTLDIQNLGDTGKKMQNTLGASHDNQGVSMLNRVSIFN